MLIHIFTIEPTIPALHYPQCVSLPLGGHSIFLYLAVTGTPSIKVTYFLNVLNESSEFRASLSWETNFHDGKCNMILVVNTVKP